MIGSAPDTVCRREPQLLKVAALILQGQIVPFRRKWSEFIQMRKICRNMLEYNKNFYYIVPAKCNPEVTLRCESAILRLP